MALMVAACSVSPAEQLDPSPTTQASATPPSYLQLGESIEEAIASGSVALETIGAVLINLLGFVFRCESLLGWVSSILGLLRRAGRLPSVSGWR
jgi:hypothetical protein